MELQQGLDRDSGLHLLNVQTDQFFTGELIPGSRRVPLDVIGPGAPDLPKDAAIVTWESGKKKPQTRQLHNLAGVGALQGAFWGMLFGLLFFIPFLGLAIGAGMGALMGSMADVGIDDKFIAEVRSKVTEGTSALFLLTSGAVLDKVTEAVKGQPFEIVSTNLSQEEEDKLKAAFAEE